MLSELPRKRKFLNPADIGGQQFHCARPFPGWPAGCNDRRLRYFLCPRTIKTLRSKWRDDDRHGCTTCFFQRIVAVLQNCWSKNRLATGARKHLLRLACPFRCEFSMSQAVDNHKRIESRDVVAPHPSPQTSSPLNGIERTPTSKGYKYSCPSCSFGQNSAKIAVPNAGRCKCQKMREPLARHPTHSQQCPCRRITVLQGSR